MSRFGSQRYGLRSPEAAKIRSKEQIWGECAETYTVIWIDAVQTDLAHCKNDSLCAIKGVSVDGGSVSHQFFVGEAFLVDNLHLFNNGRFP